MTNELCTLAMEPEVKTVQFGNTERTVMNSRVAIRYGKDRAAFINVTCWGKLAEYIGTYYKKGDEIYITGEIRNSNYKTDDRVLQTNYILITDVKRTFGQKSMRLAPADDLDDSQRELDENFDDDSE